MNVHYTTCNPNTKSNRRSHTVCSQYRLWNNTLKQCSFILLFTLSKCVLNVCLLLFLIQQLTWQCLWSWGTQQCNKELHCRSFLIYSFINRWQENRTDVPPRHSLQMLTNTLFSAQMSHCSRKCRPCRKGNYLDFSVSKPNHNHITRGKCHMVIFVCGRANRKINNLTLKPWTFCRWPLLSRTEQTRSRRPTVWQLKGNHKPFKWLVCLVLKDTMT